jgi:integrase
MATKHQLLDEILAQQAGRKVNGNKSRERTDKVHAEAIRAIFNRLYELGYRIENPKNLSEKHIGAIVRDWHARKLGNKTMQNYHSRLRIFCVQVGKSRNFIRPLISYLPGIDPATLVVHAVATRSKSWTELGIDVLAKIKEADQVDRTGRFGLILRVMLAFGLRRMEALICKPWKSGANGLAWQIFPSESKGARPRMVPIDSAEQRDLLEYVKSQIGKNEKLRWPSTPSGKIATRSWSEKRFAYFMQKIGLTKKLCGGTGHGLRHTFAENRAIVAQFVPPTLGGTGGEFDKAEMVIKREVVAESLGHARPSITNAYYGKFPKNAVGMSKKEYSEAIREGIDQIDRTCALKKLTDTARADCKRIWLVMSDFDSDFAPSLDHIFTLWTIHSMRHAVEWVQPQTEGEIAAAMFVAATKHTREPHEQAAYSDNIN